MAWSPLGWGRLTGKIKRGMEIEDGRIKSGGALGAPPVDDKLLYDIVEQLERFGSELDKSIAQVSINWLLQNKQVSNVVNGSRDEKQLISNIEAVGWNLSEKHLNQLNEVSMQPLIYPHWVGNR